MTTPTQAGGASAAATSARIIETNEAAYSYWRWHATQPDAWTAPYLAGRGLPELEHGRAPVGWTRLIAAMRKRGFTEADLLDAGLARRGSTGGLIDCFRDRLVLPIRDQTNAIIGFTARRNPVLDSDPAVRAPKYLNTTATVAFDKSRTWYGLDRAAVARLTSGEKTVVVVEGALDAEAVRTLGGPWVPLAACGTAVTAAHADALSSINPRAWRGAVIALDPDAAGAAATQHLWGQLAPDAAAEIRCVTLPGDPAQLIQDGHGGRVADALADAPRYVEALVDAHLDSLPPTFGEQHLALIGLAEAVARLDAYTLGELTDRLASGYQARPAAYLTLPDVVGAFIEAHEHHRHAQRRQTPPPARGPVVRGAGPPSPSIARVVTGLRRDESRIER